MSHPEKAISWGRPITTGRLITDITRAIRRINNSGELHSHDARVLGAAKDFLQLMLAGAAVESAFGPMPTEALTAFERAQVAMRTLGEESTQVEEKVQRLEALVGRLCENRHLPESELQELRLFFRSLNWRVQVQQVIKEYNKAVHHTPERVTSLWQNLWELWGGRVALKINVPPFPDSQERLVERKRAGDMVIYFPQEVATQENRHLLGRIWPRMGGYGVLEKNFVTEEFSHFGYRYVEASLTAPYCGTNEEELRKRIKEQKREGLTLSEYIITSQYSKLVTGHYLDEAKTRVRLLGSCLPLLGNCVAQAEFYPDGELEMDRVFSHDVEDPNFQDSFLGGRSSLGVEKT